LRKIRCDGAWPKCDYYTCLGKQCEYEASVKRRGFDRVPGSRKPCDERKTVGDTIAPATLPDLTISSIRFPMPLPVASTSPLRPARERPEPSISLGSRPVLLAPIPSLSSLPPPPVYTPRRRTASEGLFGRPPLRHTCPLPIIFTSQTTTPRMSPPPILAFNSSSSIHHRSRLFSHITLRLLSVLRDRYTPCWPRPLQHTSRGSFAIISFSDCIVDTHPASKTDGQ
jgi:hypothetical protein